MEVDMCKMLICLLLVASALLAQTVEGSVTSTSGAALAGASVTLMKAAGRNERTAYNAVTDASGGFRLQDVKDGVYVVHLQLAGFLSLNPGEPGNRPFAVEGGVSTRHLRLEMMPEGKVSGQVVDGRGSPVPGSKVVLTVPNGTFEQSTAGVDGSFAFEGVRPGTYSLLAIAPLAWKPPDSVDAQEFAWLPTFLGSVSFPEGAPPIVVRPGSDVFGQKVKLLAAPVHHLRGRLLDPAGKAAPGTRVELLDTDKREEVRSTVSKTDGSFEFVTTDRQWRLAAEAGSSTARLVASLTVLMAGKDLDVELRLTMPFSVHGSVRFDPPEGGKLPVGIAFKPEDADTPAFGKVEESGKFTAEGLYTGVYGITTAPAFPAPGYYLDAIRIGDREMLTREVEIISEYTPISILFKAGGGTIQGSVEDCRAGTVILLPQDKSMRRQGIVRVAQCLEGDRFEIPWVRPGDYYIFAFASGSTPLVSPYDLDQDYLNHAVKLKVVSGNTAQVDLKVTPPRWF
jgi:hypothetical protein